MSDLLAPMLIHIGYHKIGASWLQKHLFNNRDLGFVRLVDRPFVSPSVSNTIYKNRQSEINVVRTDFYQDSNLI